MKIRMLFIPLPLYFEDQLRVCGDFSQMLASVVTDLWSTTLGARVVLSRRVDKVKVAKINCSENPVPQVFHTTCDWEPPTGSHQT
jgi:hypothetical protein